MGGAATARMQADRRGEKPSDTDYSKALSQLLSHWKQVMIRRKVAERLAARRRTSGSGKDKTDNETNLDSGVRSISEEMSDGSVEDLEELEEEEEPKKKPWQEIDKQVYEEQLEKLQEQLVSTMLEKQSLQGWDKGYFVSLCDINYWVWSVRAIVWVELGLVH